MGGWKGGTLLGGMKAHGGRGGGLMDARQEAGRQERREGGKEGGGRGGAGRGGVREVRREEGGLMGGREGEEGSTLGIRDRGRDGEKERE